ncbi:Ribonuclease H-like superfamily [Arabidopsis thaliana x Arabidopsis arenosa]|uniref:Ribonuclease H-like superfamily n=1 Tax=Arabidopsis thaliana x Arabidopsis arenosa TaxID=1240361 RepID=A0A8T1Y7S4_9BRAS|nr:Ribonuclease H-like superfamily [Arabidopsis thaliana x Arabidopsis arenosa]
MSSHDNNDDLVDKQVQVQTSVGKKRTETQRSSSDLPSNPRKKLAQSSDIRQYFVPKDDDKESTNRTRNDIGRCELFKAYQETSEQKVLTSGDQDGFLRSVIARDIAAMYLQEKASLKKLFSAEKMRVSLTTDIWEAPNTSCSYLVVTAYWIDANWELQKRIISFKPVKDKEGETIARHLIECLDEWGIEKVFTVTVGNAEGNDKALTLFQDAMRLKGANALVKDGDFFRMRCCGDIVNLLVKESMEHVSDSIVAVRNAVKYVQSSLSRLKSFEFRIETGKVPKGNLSLDFVTEWNSNCEYFLELEEETGEKRVGPPVSATWDEVKRLVKFLEIFFSCTVGSSESKSAASSNGYSEIATIDWNLIKLTNSVDEEVRRQATSMRDKFEKYWDGLININPLVIVASVFDPKKKMKFSSLCFDMLHGKDSLEGKQLTSSIRSVMRHLCEEYTVRLNKQSQIGDAATQSDSDGFISSDYLYNEMINEMRKEEARRQLDDYLLEKVEPGGLGSDYDVLSWWKRNSSKYPILSELARDVLAIQMSSFAPESAFCTGGRILDPYRSSLTPYITEALICTQQWLRSSLQSEEQLPSLKQMFEELDFQESLDPWKQPEPGH